MKRLIRKSVQVLDGYVPGEQWHTPGIIKLNTNENPYPPSLRVAAALRDIEFERLRLYPDPTAMAVRKRIAAIHHCDVEQVFVGNGSDEILALCTRAFVEDDGNIGYFNPSYSLYPVLAAIRNVRTWPVELPADFTWRMDGNYKCSLFFLANPNAPTGVLYDRKHVRGFCKRLPGVVVIDEAYVDFSKENCMSLALELDNVLVMRTLSKSFSLAGLRVGYVVGAEPLIAALFKLKDSYNTDAIAQRLALAALSDLGHMRRNAAKIKSTRKRLTKALQDRGALVYPSESNFLWLRPAGMQAQTFYEHLRTRRILVRYFRGGRTSGFVRVTIGTDGDIDKLISAIDEISDLQPKGGK
jgi:histidinol-phosphate aminotransferase